MNIAGTVCNETTPDDVLSGASDLLNMYPVMGRGGASTSQPDGR